MRRRHRQEGAALLVSLVLVLVCTLLGLSVMESSGVEGRIVANEAVRHQTFHAAEAASETALLAVDPATLSGTAETVVPVTSIDPRIAVSASARLEGMAPAIGFSSGRFAELLYSTSATATVGEAPAIEARRVVVQGAGRRIPVAR